MKRGFDTEPAWAVGMIRAGIPEGLAEAAAIGPMDSIAVDSWGVDFAILDENGALFDQPGTYIETEMTGYRHENDGMIDVWLRDTPMHRMVKLDEIASVVQFLASDAASLMTGETVLVDGGFTCW